MTRHVPLRSPQPRSRAGGRPSCRRGSRDARRGLYSSNLCRARFIWTARHGAGDEQVGTARVLRAAVLYLSSRSGFFCSITCCFIFSWEMLWWREKDELKRFARLQLSPRLAFVSGCSNKSLYGEKKNPKLQPGVRASWLIFPISQWLAAWRQSQ